ncbi:MAG: Kef family K(+) transporter [Bauldia sp.]|nr:Kef family K(+) transporter [Bauldia sp.]
MPHDLPLITMIVAGLGIAFLLGALASRLRISPLVGYLLAGVALGPATPGYVADAELANQLAEIGVILLMFGVGLHFSLKELLAVRAIAIPGAIFQMGIATALGVGLGLLLGWTIGASLIFGLALSVASTVVLLRALQERRLVTTDRGHIAVGWLIVEDLAMVLALVIIPAIAELGGGEANGESAGTLIGTLALTIGKVVAFVAIMLIAGRRIIPWLLHRIVHGGSRELFRLAVLAVALGVAFGASELFGVSFALGAFFAGMVLGESPLSQRAAQEILPLRDAFAVLFFVSVGMLFDPAIIIEQPLPVLATVAIIVFGKSAAAFAIVRLFGHPNRTALTISASLAQIGEFSFILAALGVSLMILPQEGQDLILAGAILSILINPLLFVLIGRKEPVDDVTTVPGVEPAGPRLTPTTLSGHAVVLGHGRVGQVIADELRAAGVALVVVDEDEDHLTLARAAGNETIFGNAVREDVLKAANIVGARWLFVAIPGAYEASDVVATARAANPALRILARAHADAEVDNLRAKGADTVIMGEREIALGLVAAALAGGGPAPDAPATPTSADNPTHMPASG